MKKSNKRVLSGLILTSLVMMSHTSYAGLGDKFSKYIGSGNSNFSGLYIILGVIGVGVIGKLFQHFFLKEEEKPMSNVKISQHSHHRHHKPRPMIKKTS